MVVLVEVFEAIKRRRSIRKYEQKVVKKEKLLTVLEAAQSENFLGKLISLGAILNLIRFFYFIRKCS